MYYYYDLPIRTPPADSGGGTNYNVAAAIGLVANMARTALVADRAAATITVRPRVAGSAAASRLASGSLGIRPRVAASPAGALRAVAAVAARYALACTPSFKPALAATLRVVLRVTGTQAANAKPSRTIGITQRLTGSQAAAERGVAALAARLSVSMLSATEQERASASLGMRAGEAGGTGSFYTRAASFAATFGITATARTGRLASATLASVERITGTLTTTRRAAAALAGVLRTAGSATAADRAAATLAMRQGESGAGTPSGVGTRQASLGAMFGLTGSVRVAFRVSVTVRTAMNYAGATRIGTVVSTAALGIRAAFITTVNTHPVRLIRSIPRLLAGAFPPSLRGKIDRN